MARVAAACLCALLLAVTVARNAAIDALAEVDPALASRIWGGHPAVEINLSMMEIARAARTGKTASPDAFQRIDDAARKAPLAPESFLVAGVQAQVARQDRTAERAFLAAEWRDPRSMPAHYFLAQNYLRHADAEHGLKEVLDLARLSPGGAGTTAPYFAAFARDSSTWPRLRTLFRTNPEIEAATLIALAHDEANAQAILALSTSDQRGAETSWLPVLIGSMVAAGDYAKARSIWASVSEVSAAPQSLLFDSGFARPEPPAPFNWMLTSSTVGLAERQRGGRLHAIFYGQEDGVLAQQLVVLAPGRYRLSMQLLGGLSQARALSWVLTCARAQAPAASIPLELAAARGWEFDVPANCPAQWIQLVGTSSDLPQQSDVTIADLRLTAEGRHD